MSDTGLLTELAAEADAFVHSVGLLLDRESGLGGVNFITSGSRSVPAEGATYDTVMRDSAAALAAAARSGATGGAERPLVYVSAAEAAWCESEGGQKLEAALPEFLGRYLSAKREAEALLQASSGLRVVLARPSLMYDWSKLDVLPLLPIVNPASALGQRYGGGLGLLSKMLRVHVVGAAVVAALEAPEARGARSPAELEEMAPLGALRRVGPFDTLTSGLASIARLPYGTTVAEERRSAAAAGARPKAEQLRLYEFEACPPRHP